MKEKYSQHNTNLVKGRSLEFAIKAELKERPHIFITLIFLLSISMASFCLRCAEMPVDDIRGEEGFGWRYYWNSLWVTVITMTTVGYGDIYPVSTMGKCVCIIMCFWGNFLISLIIISLANLVEF